MDLHEDIHRAVENYQDENEFRRWLNSALQDSRGVTFLLQKRKSKWSNFDSWYLPWQDDAKDNLVLSWGVRSRNRIVKEEDLRTFSQVIISYFGERLQQAEDVLAVPPRVTAAEILYAFRYLIDDKPVRRKGWIRVQRRWVDDQLPDYELVAALKEIYVGVARIVQRAHEASGVGDCLAPAFARACVTAKIDPDLRCLGDRNPIPDGIIDANTGEMMRLAVGRMERDDSSIAVGKQRYGYVPPRSKDPLEHAEGRMELSKRFLEADGYAGPMLMLFRGMDDLRLNGLFFGSDESRELKVAATVDMQGAWPFDGAVFATEAWIGTSRNAFVDVAEEDVAASDTEFFDADPVGGRGEALVVYALMADGRYRTLMQPFARVGDGIAYGDLRDDASPGLIPPFLRPIWRRWSKWRDGPPVRP